MYYRVGYPKIQVLDNNGNLAADYEIHTYHAALATVLTTYSDRGLTVPNTNPVILDARGEADIYVGEAAKLILTIPGGDPTSPIWEVDYIGEMQANFVTGSATPVTANNNYVVSTTPAVLALSNNFQLIMTPDVPNVDTIGTNTFTGTGANDCTASGPYLGAAPATFTIKIDGAIEAAPGAPTATETSDVGLVTVGNHYVKISFVTAIGETLPGTASAVVASDGAETIDVTAIPVSANAQVTARNVYMTKAGGTVYYYVGQVAGNITTTFTISIADATLGTGIYVLAPTVDTTGISDTFTWKKDGGAWHPGVVITAAAQILMEGFTVTFATIAGHVFGDIWAIVAKTPARLNLDGLGNLLIYKNKGGAVIALDGNDMLAGYPAQLILNAALNAWLLINPATPVYSTSTISAIRYRSIKTGAYIVTINDQGRELSCTGTFTITLPTAPVFANRFFYVRNSGLGLITVDAGIYTIYGRGESTFVIAPGKSYQFVSNGVDWHILTASGDTLLLSYQDVTAGTALTFTGLLPGLKYRLVIEIQLISVVDYITILFNADAGANYEGVVDELDNSTGLHNMIPITTNTCYITGIAHNGASRPISAVIEFENFLNNNKKVKLFAKASYRQRLTDGFIQAHASGIYTGAADLTSVTVGPNSGTCTGRIWLYQVE